MGARTSLSCSQRSKAKSVVFCSNSGQLGSKDNCFKCSSNSLSIGFVIFCASSCLLLERWGTSFKSASWPVLSSFLASFSASSPSVPDSIPGSAAFKLAFSCDVLSSPLIWTASSASAFTIIDFLSSESAACSYCCSFVNLSSWD